MNQQTDKLFRDKLEGFSKPVPSHAWDRVEKNLDNRAGLVIWWKVAAAVLLLATITYIVWPAEKNMHAPSWSENQKKEEPAKSNAPEVTRSPLVAEKILPAVEPDRKVKTEKSYKKQTPPVNTPEAIDGHSTDDAITVAEANVQDETPVEEITEQANVVIEEETAVVKTAEPVTQNITLVFRADDTDEYLDKKALAKATEEEEKASTFKKLLKKAKGLKNNQDPFGELRQKKNEILALNFKSSEKEKRGQNK